MTTWTKTCAFEHKAIKRGHTVFVATMRPIDDHPDRWSFVMPPILAVTGEPGEVTLIEEYAHVSPSKGIPWRPDVRPELDHLPVCFCKDVFANVANLPIHPNSSRKISISQIVDAERRKIKIAVTMSQSRTAKIPPYLPTRTRKNLLSIYSGTKNILGSSNNEDVMVGFPRIIENFIRNGIAIDPFLDHYVRAYMLNLASKVTGKTLTPIDRLPQR